jgi:hypothetical protein
MILRSAIMKHEIRSDVLLPQVEEKNIALRQDAVCGPAGYTYLHQVAGGFDMNQECPEVNKHKDFPCILRNIARN